MIATFRISGWTAVLVGCMAVSVAAQMPDARQMSGIPRPVEDLPTGTVSVRVVRGDLAKVAADVPVELVVAGRASVIRTDDQGRAEFKGLAAGSVARASARLDGARLESEEFSLPPSGGVRLLLSGPPAGTAAASATAAPTGGAAPAVPGTVLFGGETRIVMQFADDELEVFYLLDIVNDGAAPVTAEPLVFDMPADAQGTSVLEGSTPQAVAEGQRVTISGPFAPGRTVAEIAYTLPPGGDRARIAQRFPAALSQVTIIVQKVGRLTVLSPAIREQREVSDQGRLFLMGTGPGLAAGETVVVDLAGLPHVAPWPAFLAVTLAGLVLAAGAYAAMRPGAGGASAARARLAARRDELLADLLALDAKQRAGRIEPQRHSSRREDLMVELERIYGALDSASDGMHDDTRQAG